jgi:hypothetical protein
MGVRPGAAEIFPSQAGSDSESQHVHGYYGWRVSRARGIGHGKVEHAASGTTPHTEHDASDVSVRAPQWELQRNHGD